MLDLHELLIIFTNDSEGKQLHFSKSHNCNYMKWEKMKKEEDIIKL
jgi:hypothetical protein